MTMGRDVDPRFVEAWREWLAALATDADSALAAAHVYEQLEPEGRDAWLDALEEDGPQLAVPPVALYAPLLSVETDPARRARIELALIAQEPERRLSRRVRALRALLANGDRITVLVTPVYLDFVKVLALRYAPDRGFTWVRDAPMSHRRDAPTDGTMLEGVRLESTPLQVVVEELARAILAARRLGAALPAALTEYASLFDVDPDGGETAS
jgi:hypothetical protein